MLLPPVSHAEPVLLGGSQLPLTRDPPSGGLPFQGKPRWISQDGNESLIIEDTSNPESQVTKPVCSLVSSAAQVHTLAPTDGY